MSTTNARVASVVLTELRIA